MKKRLVGVVIVLLFGLAAATGAGMSAVIRVGPATQMAAFPR